MRRTPTPVPAAAKSASRPARPTDQAKATALKVAIVHDWLIGGGAELVVEQLHALYPDAPIYTSYCTREWRKRLDRKVKTGWLQIWPLSRLRKFLPLLRTYYFSHLKLRGYDLIISSSGSGEAKGIRPPDNATYILYCHSPTHFYWSRYNEYLKNPGFGAFNWLARIGLKTFAGRLRKWDYKAVQHADYIIANSNHIKNQVQEYYDRSAVIINPPVYTERFKNNTPDNKRHGFVISGRQTPYKRFDLAVVACSKLNLPLTVIGDGPDHRRLRKLAGKSVTFLGKASDAVIAEEFSIAKAFIFPGIDDFGISPVEAMAAGTPVIAYKAGGALDYVVPGKTGLFFEEQTAKSLAIALKQFSREQFNGQEIARMADRYSTARFAQKMRLFIRKSIG